MNRTQSERERCSSPNYRGRPIVNRRRTWPFHALNQHALDPAATRLNITIHSPPHAPVTFGDHVRAAGLLRPGVNPHGEFAIDGVSGVELRSVQRVLTPFRRPLPLQSTPEFLEGLHERFTLVVAEVGEQFRHLLFVLGTARG